tara:strand:- start:204 stop:347 length:144 start_codon:yes stop_codon:yes gene_type:complete
MKKIIAILSAMLVSFSLLAQKTGPFGEIDDEDENENLTLQLSTGFYF